MVRLKEGESRVYNVKLKQNALTVPSWRRTKKSINVLREYIEKHTKSDDVRITKWVNEKIWARGGKNPPAKISVKVTKEKDNVIKVDLAEHSAKVKRELKKIKAQETTSKAGGVSASEESVNKKDKEAKKKQEKVSKQQEKDIHKTK